MEGLFVDTPEPSLFDDVQTANERRTIAGDIEYSSTRIMKPRLREIQSERVAPGRHPYRVREVAKSRDTKQIWILGFAHTGSGIEQLSTYIEIVRTPSPAVLIGVFGRRHVDPDGRNGTCHHWQQLDCSQQRLIALSDKL